MITYSRPKRSDLYTLCWSKLRENHTLHSGTYLYGPYMAVPPPRDVSQGQNWFWNTIPKSSLTLGDVRIDERISHKWDISMGTHIIDLSRPFFSECAKCRLELPPVSSPRSFKKTCVFFDTVRLGGRLLLLFLSCYSTVSRLIEALIKCIFNVIQCSVLKHFSCWQHLEVCRARRLAKLNVSTKKSAKPNLEVLSFHVAHFAHNCDRDRNIGKHCMKICFQRWP